MLRSLGSRILAHSNHHHHHHLVCLQKKSIGYFITTPIFYVNSSPHIGHVHTLLLADALNIFNRLKLNSEGDCSTLFSTGTDEHGIKIQNAATANKMAPKEFCDMNARKFYDLFKVYNTTLTDFVRTTEERHEEAVLKIWSELDKRGFIYKSSYAGWYCSSDEVFVPESHVSEKEVNGKMINIDQNGNEVVWSSEENYMFKFGDVEDHVYDWLSEYKPLYPAKFNKQALEMMNRNPIGDISISRPKSRLNWGIRVPNDPEQTVYVWLDALTSYLTVAGYPCDLDKLRRWPIDCQVIGKDIIKFHSIYWPAFLIALSLPLPRKLICHSHWLVESYKMSKSRGNVIDPLEENERLTMDGVRYYLLRASTPHSDTDYNKVQARFRVNVELADTYGNLLNRCTSPIINPTASFPTKLTKGASMGGIDILVDQLKKTINDCTIHYENANFYKGVDQIMASLRLANALYQEARPWSLVKEMDSNRELFSKYSNVQAIMFETLRICSILLQPIVPNVADKALTRLRVTNRSWDDARLLIEFGDPTVDPHPIMPPGPIVFQKLR